jgi:hypothetical protein
VQPLISDEELERRKKSRKGKVLDSDTDSDNEGHSEESSIQKQQKSR